ncbi:hypothetical protein D3OALGA1CA_3343 [Olavius algarvensis associated proteobacterium Delta 3]|nr:hypothetical protein D3OALGB2SA_1467 [Olavius algarvensis associated proteobacterium Delta 3]CAB5132861.1 hypothetical protein D3OALGA1CA_3343 [Olavius algarvensis associated proteobacterium Delta 3]
MITQAEIMQFVSSIVYSLLGLVVFSFAFWILTKILPFSVKKEIVEDENTALGIILGALVVGLAIIIAAAIS